MLHTSFCLLLATVCASIIPSLAASTGNSVYDVHFERLRQRRTSFRRHRRRDGPSSLPAGQTSIVTSDFRSCADAPAGYSLSEANVMHSTTTPLSCKYKDNSSSDYKYCFYDNNGDSTSGSGFFGTATMTCPPMSFARNDGDQCFTSCPDSHDSKFILSPNDSSVIFIAPATDMFTRCWYTDGSSDVRICDFKATTGGFNAESSPSPEEDCPSASLLDGQCVSPKTGANLPPPPPRRGRYRGRYDGLSVYHIAQDCGDRIFDAYHTGSVVQIAAEDDVILHVRPSDLDLAVFPSHSATSVLDSAQEALALPVAGITGPRGDQIAFTKSASARLIHLSSTSAFFSIPLSTLHAHLESLTRIPYAELTLVPSHDLPLDRSRLDEDRKRIQHVTDNLSFQSIIGNISASVKKRELKSVVRHLTGEDGRAGWSTRHSFTEGAVQAAHWLKEQYERTGATCHFHHYFTGFSPNVICRYEPLLTSSANVSQSPVVVIAAHYDDRGTWGYTRAPGGDDDGSGSTMLLNLARTIGEYGVRFKDIEVVLAAFSGEEQGLWGSRYYAKSLRDEGRDVLFMLQADMIAYRKPGEPMQLAFPDVHSIPEGRWLVGNVSRLYTPELVTGITPACCSDSQSFDDEGFASSWVFERNGPIADPKYHNSGDLSDREGYDFEQLRLITSTVIATLLSFVPFQV